MNNHIKYFLLGLIIGAAFCTFVCCECRVDKCEEVKAETEQYQPITNKFTPYDLENQESISFRRHSIICINNAVVLVGGDYPVQLYERKNGLSLPMKCDEE